MASLKTGHETSAGTILTTGLHRFAFVGIFLSLTSATTLRTQQTSKKNAELFKLHANEWDFCSQGGEHCACRPGAVKVAYGHTGSWDVRQLANDGDGGGLQIGCSLSRSVLKPANGNASNACYCGGPHTDSSAGLDGVVHRSARALPLRVDFKVFGELERAHEIPNRRRRRTAGQEIGNNGPRTFVLHVGPGKMGTTTIQASLDDEFTKNVLRRDGWCARDLNTVHIGGEKLPLGAYLNQVGREKKSEAVDKLIAGPTFKEFVRFLDECYEAQLNVVVSSESLGLLHPTVWQRVLLPSVSRWNVKIALGYRRLYDWLPSVWYQMHLQTLKLPWPAPGNSMVPPLLDWTASSVSSVRNTKFFPHAMRLHTSNYLAHWVDLGIDRTNILIYNMAELTAPDSGGGGVGLYDVFFGQLLGAEYTAEFAKLSIKYDSAAAEAVHSNTGNPRFVQIGRLARLFHERQSTLLSSPYAQPSYSQQYDKHTWWKTTNHFSKLISDEVGGYANLKFKCIADPLAELVLSKSREIEMLLLPDFYASEHGGVTMQAEFDKLRRKGKYCDLDIEAAFSRLVQRMPNSTNKTGVSAVLVPKVEHNLEHGFDESMAENENLRVEVSRLKEKVRNLQQEAMLTAGNEADKTES